MDAPGHAPADAFFLDTADGPRFCLYHAPVGECRGALVYIHPFAEEMNRSRRMAALQARALTAQGFGVLLLDLHGCGDSGGDFGQFVTRYQAGARYLPEADAPQRDEAAAAHQRVA